MKLAISSLLLLFSVNAFATGGFHCTGQIKNNETLIDISVSGGTSRVEGSPLLSNILVNMDELENFQTEIPKERVVGYWNGDNFFMINIADKEINRSQIKIQYDVQHEAGEMTVNFLGFKETTKKVKCLFE
jgi:hypothetical protein